MNQKPKHYKISSELRADITSGRYGSNSRLPSESQLVKTYGVSRPTAARALLDLEKEGLIVRRPGSGTYVRSEPAMPATTRQIGLLVPGLETTEIFSLICGEIASLCQANDYSLLWGGSSRPHDDTDSSQEHALEICNHFIERKVSGVFFAPFELTTGQEKTNQQLLGLLTEVGIPVVLLDRDYFPYPRRSNFDLVGIDNFAAGFILAEHLLGLGCERLFFVARPLSAPTVNSRMAGVREALTQNGIEPAPNWTCLGDPTDLKFVRSITSGNQADAFVCANDFTAGKLMRSLEILKIRVPQDARVVGFDDVKFSTLLTVPLTTIHQPCQDVATVAFNAMLERIARKSIPARNLILTPTLVVRESCGAYMHRKTSTIKNAR